MGWYDGVKCAGRSFLLGTALLGSAVLGMKDAKGEEVEKPAVNPVSIATTLDDAVKKSSFPQKRSIVLDFENPQDSYDANSSLWYSLNQLIAKGDDFAGYAGLDGNLAGRFLSTLLIGYFSTGLNFYSHEMAHNYVDREYGERHNPHLDFSEWWGCVYPNFVQYPLKKGWSRLSMDSFIKTVADGLNQEEHNADIVWRNYLLEDNCDLYNSFAFFCSKTMDLQYILSVGFNDHPLRKQRLSVQSLFGFFYANSSLANDVDQYTILLYNKKIKLCKEKFFLQAFIADALSWQTLDSYISLGRYLAEGKRTHKPAKLDLGKNIRLSPPLINCYLTPTGIFYNANFFLLSAKSALELSLGHDADFIGGGKVNHLRFGGKFYSQKLFKPFKINPFIYINSNRIKPAYQGASAGIELIFYPLKDIGIKGRIEYNQNDILENTIKGKKQGIKFTAGTEIRF